MNTESEGGELMVVHARKAPMWVGLGLGIMALLLTPTILVHSSNVSLHSGLLVQPTENLTSCLIGHTKRPLYQPKVNPAIDRHMIPYHVRVVKRSKHGSIQSGVASRRRSMQALYIPTSSL